MNPLLATTITLVLTASLAVPAQAADRVEAERMNVSMRTGHVVRDASASGKRALLLTGRGRARASLTVPAAAQLKIVVRGRRCAGAPRMAVAIDGAGAAKRRVRSRHWTTFRSRPALAAATHRVALRLANPHRSRRCHRGVFVDALIAKGSQVQPVPQPQPQAKSPGRWIPAPRTTWQWQLSTPVDVSVPAQMFDIDLFDNSPEVVAELHRRGARAVCYFSAGSIEGGRPDAGAFPADVIGQPLEGWPNERWLDVRRLDVLGPVFERRLDLCKAKGFDGVEADNIDAYTHTTGFPSPATTSSGSTASSPPPRTPAACRSGSRTTSSRRPCSSRTSTGLSTSSASSTASATACSRSSARARRRSWPSTTSTRARSARRRTRQG